MSLTAVRPFVTLLIFTWTPVCWTVAAETTGPDAPTKTGGAASPTTGSSNTGSSNTGSSNTGSSNTGSSKRVGDVSNNDRLPATRKGLLAASRAASQPIKDFRLPTIDENVVSLSDHPTAVATVVCFLGTQCPLARIYGPRLQRLSEQFAEHGVRFIGVNSNIQDSMEEWKQYALAHQIKFPLAKDFDRRVAINFGATRTPEVFMIDRTGAVRYRGRIDDQYEPGLSRKSATRHDLRDALSQLIDGQSIDRPETQAVGCLIALPRVDVAKADAAKADAAKAEVTFCDQVIRVLHEHCVECHREGEIGPFALDDYDEVVGWADMSLEVIQQGRMPPWHASPEHGSFANSRFMSQQDIQVLQAWVDAGLPYGNPADLPPKPQYASGWRFDDPPDAILAMDDQPFRVPAEGTVEYQYFVVDPGFTEDKWIRGAQVIPGNSAVVHHCIVFTRPPDGADAGQFGFLSAYVPGQVRGTLPSGYAQRVAAGSKLVFQMHYTPTGKPEQDITRLGLVFADPRDVTHEVYVLGGIEQEFEIPPGSADYRVDGSIGGFPKQGHLLSIMPHMHLRGKSFSFQVVSPDGVETLLKVPQYDFNWQHNYELTDPLPLHDVDELNFVSVFDNSADNPSNPDPTEFVTWGDQTWQEMAVTFVSVARPLASAKKTEQVKSQNHQQPRPQQEAEWTRKASKFADTYLARFDKNEDGFLTAFELPDSVRLFGFYDFDHDGDDRVSREEIRAEAYWNFRRGR